MFFNNTGHVVIMWCTCYERTTTHIASRRSLLATSRRADAGYATSERDTKRARRADAGYATSERDAKRAWRADADYSTSERDAKRARRADADYAIFERDTKRARRADADKKSSDPVLLAYAFSLRPSSIQPLFW
jgi:hypothetical protein